MKLFRIAVVMAGIAMLAACGAPPPPPPPPPPPVVEVVPPRPVMPVAYQRISAVPPVGADGVRHTVLTDSRGAALVWNLRAALNVAALNCRDARYQDITRNYGTYLKLHAKGLDGANKAGDADYKARFGKDGIATRETYLTSVYNFFAFPPTMPQFCEAALDVSREAAMPHPDGLETFSARAFMSFAGVWEGVYRDWEKVRSDMAAWDARYGASSTQ